MIVYKIRRKHDGLFSQGGRAPRFSKIGKAWKRPHDLTRHLNFVDDYRFGSRVYNDCEIVTYELTETEVKTKSVNSYIAERITKRRERELKELQHKQERERQKRYEEYLRLKEEFGR